MNVRRYLFTVIAGAALLCALLSGCAVHQWPELEDAVEDAPLRIHLSFHTEMILWEHEYDINTKKLTEIQTESPVVYDNTQSTGVIRYIVRIYPRTETRNARSYLQELDLTRELTKDGYDFDTELTLPFGEYRIVAWADIRGDEAEKEYYDASDFASVVSTRHSLNTDYRDAFRGAENVKLEYDPASPAAKTVQIEMHRPLAKCEIIAEGIEDFLRKNPARSGLSDYRLILAYQSYTPFAYSAMTDLLVDSRYGEYFESRFTPIDETSASLGFDYHLVRSEGSSTILQVAVFGPDGEELSMSNPVQIPLRRDHHTVVRGKFLSGNASGGFVGVDPRFEGDFNIFR